MISFEARQQNTENHPSLVDSMERFVHIILGFILAFACIEAEAQNTMRITQKDGAVLDIPITNVDNISFVTVEEPEGAVTICGTWKWVGLEEGYSETLTFNADGTFTCVDNYFAYGFDNQTYGTYMFFGSMLNLRSNGYGYNRFYQWMVTELTEEKLTVLTKMGSFTYTKVK